MRDNGRDISISRLDPSARSRWISGSALPPSCCTLARGELLRLAEVPQRFGMGDDSMVGTRWVHAGNTVGTFHGGFMVVKGWVKHERVVKLMLQ